VDTDRIAELEQRVRELEEENEALKLKLHAAEQFNSEKDHTSISIDISTIPEFLRNGEYYANLCGDNDEGENQIGHEDDTGSNIISVPRKCFKSSTKIDDMFDLYRLLTVLRFWMVTALPESVISYALDLETSAIFKSIAKEFLRDLPMLAKLQTVADSLNKSPEGRMEVALEEKAPSEIIQFLLVLLDRSRDSKSWDNAISIAIAQLAAKCGSLECLQFMVKKQWARFYSDGKVSEMAAEGGHLDCLKYIHEQGWDWGTHTCRKAAKNGHLGCLKYAHEHGCEWNARTTYAAASKGHLDCLQYAHEHGCPLDTGNRSGSATFAAANAGYQSCMRYAHTHGYKVDDFICERIIAGGHVSCLKYLCEHSLPIHPQASGLAVMSKQLECLRYLTENGYATLDQDCCLKAAILGYIDILDYARERGCVLTATMLQKAAKRGHIDCVCYLHEHGCPWDSSAYPAACTNDHVECFIYLHTQGCPIATGEIAGLYRSAREMKAVKCIKYLRGVDKFNTAIPAEDEEDEEEDEDDEDDDWYDR